MFVIYYSMKIWRKRLTDLINQSMSDEAVYRTVEGRVSENMRK